MNVFKCGRRVKRMRKVKPLHEAGDENAFR